MSIKQLQNLEKKISKIKSDITEIKDMRPGSLSLQYKDRKDRFLLPAELYKKYEK